MDSEVNKLFNLSNSIYKKVYQSGNKKFQFLPEWLNSQARYYKSDLKPSKNKKTFQRGSLIMVDFGINVGNELSGNHFAVVLNKSDSPQNGVLTVVPVSSKGNKFSVELDGLISDKSLKTIDKYIKQQELMVYLLNKMTIKKDLTDEEKHELVTENINGAELTYSKYIDVDTADKEYSLIEEEINKLSQIVKHYSKYNEISYAKCLDITTVSKKRIRHLNEYDPCGKIKVSVETLNKIDKQLKKTFINS